MNCRVQDNLREWNLITSLAFALHKPQVRHLKFTSLIRNCHSIHYATAEDVFAGIFCKRYEHIRRYTILIEIEASLHGWDQSNVKLFIGYARIGWPVCCLFASLAVLGIKNSSSRTLQDDVKARSTLAGIDVWQWNHWSVCQRRSKITNEVNCSEKLLFCTKEL